MTPAARLATAMDLLERVGRAGAADREVQAFFRARRFAGAKDRAAITELVYLIERRQAELRHRLGEDAGARLQVLLAALLFQDLPLSQAEALCNGEKYAPAPIQEAERAALLAALRIDPATGPDWVRLGYPAWLDGELRRRFGADLESEMAAMQQRAPLDLRVNLLRGSRAEVARALDAIGVAHQPAPFSPVGLRLAGRPRLDGLALFQSGHFEPQDAGSQVAALLLGAGPGECVVDLCAGAGGKTLAIAAAMGNRGRLIASDAGPERLRRLPARLQRAGVRMVEVLPAGGSGFEGLQADRVLLDVPCSGTGTWRRQPWARWTYGPDELARDLQLQRMLLDQGAALLRPGGRLVYVTCSLLPAEDEDQIAAFLARRQDFRLLPPRLAWAGNLEGACPVGEDTLLLTPARHSTDGFFVAILERME